MSLGASGVCRRITVPLDGSSSEVKVENLMRDDASYTSTDMPRVNPSVKVRGSQARPHCACS